MRGDERGTSAFLKESSAKNFNKGLLKSKTALRRRFAVSKTRLPVSPKIKVDYFSQKRLGVEQFGVEAFLNGRSNMVQ